MPLSVETLRRETLGVAQVVTHASEVSLEGSRRETGERKGNVPPNALAVQHTPLPLKFPKGNSTPDRLAARGRVELALKHATLDHGADRRDA